MIRLYTDEDIHKNASIALRLRSYDVVSAHEIKNWGISDLQQLEYAVSQQRAIFTFNTGDFIKLHKGYIQKKKTHFGILLSKQLTLKETINHLTSFLYNHSSKDLNNNIFWI